MANTNENSTIGIGWYVHLPFCRTKCGYCDFYSLPTVSSLIPDLVRAIVGEIDLRMPNRPVRTIFVGGGTPTELPAENLDELLEAIGRMAGAAVSEWTVEANPSSASDLKLDVLRRRGVNRISFGAQSFFPEDLAVLERIHDPSHIPESIDAARRAGFDNVNLDLIYGIPGQSMQRWRESLARAIDLGTDHLSCYSLMYETGTALTKFRDQGRVTPCDESLEADMFEATIDVLANAGYVQYEISNFAKPGRRCEANLIYWRNEEYLGVGPSAVSYLDGLRRKNIVDVRKYVNWMAGQPDDLVVESESLTPMARAAETAIQMLRLIEGIDRTHFIAATGFDPISLFADALSETTTAGLVEITPTHIRLTRRGLLLSNYVMRAFLSAVEDENPTRAPTQQFVTLQIEKT
ncbi:MAG: radical SAM family heme chaperone HemW [Phycisphaerales bacterium]|nr:radical SAM family heme chaperone HemW [Phycisphaerales bacterium]MCB9855998.1 radical SAM family heme chaperone HemW [Phycisphaerales bacterium]MCB9864975.1 radical SAM family heme chaperone HemW [Phycisphaerales bacterium]